MAGYLYCAWNHLFPHLRKVGYTTNRDINVRISQFNASNIPTDYVCELKHWFPNICQVEKQAHKELRRLHFAKEFFRASREEVKHVFNKLIAEHGGSKEAPDNVECVGTNDEDLIDPMTCTLEKDHPYCCIRCGYQTKFKTSIAKHFYDRAKPCPALVNDIELTEEVKQYILANKIYRVQRKREMQRLQVNPIISKHNPKMATQKGMKYMPCTELEDDCDEFLKKLDMFIDNMDVNKMNIKDYHNIISYNIP